MENLNNDPIVEEVVDAPVVEETKVEETPAPAVEVKAEEPAVKEDDAIKAPSYPRTSEPQAVGPVAGGAIGTTTAKPAVKKDKPAQPKAEKPSVAIRSTKNVSWVGVGKVSKGINIVTEEAAAQWLTRDHITKVSPSEVAKEYGN